MTFEGWQVWDVALRMRGQQRVAFGGVVGWDLGTALALSAALCVPLAAAAELLPLVEAVAVPALNARASDG